MLNRLLVLLFFACSAIAQVPVAELVKDINTGRFDAKIGYLTKINANTALMFAEDEYYGRELWATDGTREGTRLVKDIAPGKISSEVNQGKAAQRPVVLQGVLYFLADDSIHGLQLWRSDGTTSGTFSLTHSLKEGHFNAMHFLWLTVYKNSVYFWMEDKKGWNLYQTGGTEATTTLVKGLNFSSYPTQLVEFKGALHFTGWNSDERGGSSLWKTDGTSSGTVRTGAVFSGVPNTITPVGNYLYCFLKNDKGLWKTDGTASGTQLIREMVGTGYVTKIFETRGLGYFWSDERKSFQNRLWRTDGTMMGTMALSGEQHTNSFLVYKGQCFFTYQSKSGQGQELWTTAGTPETTQPFSTSFTGTAPHHFTESNGMMYYYAQVHNDVNRAGLGVWQTDGTHSGTRLIGQLGERISLPRFPHFYGDSFGTFGEHEGPAFLVLGNKLLFIAQGGINSVNNETFGAELYRLPLAESRKSVPSNTPISSMKSNEPSTNSVITPSKTSFQNTPSLKTDYAFRKYLLENVRYPEAALQQSLTASAYVFFEVSPEGKIINVETGATRRGVGFEQAIEQALLTAPLQSKSAVGKYFVPFEFNLWQNGQLKREEESEVAARSTRKTAVVELNTVKIEATAHMKITTSTPTKKPNSYETPRQQSTPPPSEKPITAAQPKETKTLSDGLGYTMRKVEREFDWKSKKTGKSVGAITAYYEYPTFSDEKINVALRNKVIKKSSFETAADAYIADQKETYANFKDEDFGLSGLGQGYSLSIKVIRQNPRFVFFKADWSEENEGAAHGQYGEAYLIYDHNLQQMIPLDAILTGSGRYELRQIAERVFRREEKLSPNASLCDNYLFDKCRFELAENFTVTENVLEFIYNPYEGKSFAVGIWSVKLPYSLIKHLIKPEYGALFGQATSNATPSTKATATTTKNSNVTLAYLKEYDGQLPSQVGLFENAELSLRMKKLMGEASFDKFFAYAKEEKPIQFYNGLALITGCKQNDCERYESAVFINTSLDKISIGLLDNDQVQTWSDHQAFKSYDPTSMPTEFKAWFLEASRKARERKGNTPKKPEENGTILSARSTNLLGTTSPEELGKILLRALQNNDKTTWIRCIHPEQVDDREIIIRKFAEVRDHLYQQGLTNWSTVRFSRVTFIRNDHKSVVKGAKVAGGFTIEFTYKNDEFVGEIYFWSAATVAYESTYFIWGYPDLSNTRLIRNLFRR